MAGAAAVAAGAAYGISHWARMATWGATPEEVAEALPGDELIGSARYRTTHAVTIDAPVERVWPWVVQLGQGRGGMYSYDWLENLAGLHMHSADRIVPELQTLAVGDVVRLVPEGAEPSLRFVVEDVQPPHLLVLGPDTPREQALASGMPYPAWTFRLTSPDAHHTRLVVRFQSDFAPTALGWVMNKYALEPVHFVMERKMLLGIKDRAEHAA